MGKPVPLYLASFREYSTGGAQAVRSVRKAAVHEWEG